MKSLKKVDFDLKVGREVIYFCTLIKKCSKFFCNLNYLSLPLYTTKKEHYSKIIILNFGININVRKVKEKSI